MWTNGNWATADVQVCVWRASTFDMVWTSIAARWWGAIFARSNCNRANTSSRLASCGLQHGKAQWAGHRRWVDCLDDLWGMPCVLFRRAEPPVWSLRQRLSSAWPSSRSLGSKSLAGLSLIWFCWMAWRHGSVLLLGADHFCRRIIRTPPMFDIKHVMVGFWFKWWYGRQHLLRWQLGRISCMSLVLRKRKIRMDLKDIVSSLEGVRLRFGPKFLWSQSMTVGKSPIPGQKSKLDFGRRMISWKRLTLMFILAQLGWSKKSSERKIKSQDSFDAFNNDESIGDFYCRVLVWTVRGSPINFWSRLLAFLRSLKCQYLVELPCESPLCNMLCIV